MQELEVFIEGENIDLRIPTLDFAKESNWFKWFNDPIFTSYLMQGQFPNTREAQADFYLNSKQDRIVLIIHNKQGMPYGVTALQNLNFISGSAVFTIATDIRVMSKNLSLSNLEAAALITEHGMQKLGLSRITASIPVALNRWQQRLELLGYQLEGIHKGGFKKGIQVETMTSVACLKEGFELLAEKRDGRIWDGSEKMKNRIESLPSPNFQQVLNNFLEKEKNSYYEAISKL